MTYFEQYLPQAHAILLQYGISFLKALLLFLIGKFIAKHISLFFAKMVFQTTKDTMLESFIRNITYPLLLTFVIIASINQLGVHTASLVAIFGAAGLAITLAFRGSLSNFAAGMMIVIFRPYNTGDLIETAGKTGTVEEIDMFTTRLRMGDKTKVTVPNAKIFSNTITNYTEAGIRRHNFIIGISYDADIALAKAVLLQAIEKSDSLLLEPAPVIGVVELADNSVNIAVRPWTNASDYARAGMEMLENIKVALDEAKIGIPYPQRDVHVFNHSAVSQASNQTKE